MARDIEMTKEKQAYIVLVAVRVLAHDRLEAESVTRGILAPTLNGMSTYVKERVNGWYVNAARLVKTA